MDFYMYLFLSAPAPSLLSAQLLYQLRYCFLQEDFHDCPGGSGEEITPQTGVPAVPSIVPVSVLQEQQLWEKG